jgi:UDP-N-acetylglucosamine:LPS N-acetylglucosamine transferase
VTQRAAPKILAVASGGGHWVELLQILPALEGGQLCFATVNADYRSDVAGHGFHRITDATRWNRLALCRLVLELAWILLRERPDVVVTTGAAPGYLALRLGRWLGARTVWIDSIANADELSLSGEMAGRCADLWLTQWAHLTRDAGPEYAGAVL